MKNKIKVGRIIGFLFVIFLASCDGGKSPKEFAKEMCNEMDNGSGIMQIAKKVGKERNKHSASWFEEYKEEVNRLGCAHQNPY